MAEGIKTTWDDVSKKTVEIRGFTSCGQSARRNGRSNIDIICPFCNDRVTTYKWSLCGGGKRCGCGALFGSLGDAYKKLEEK